MSILLRGGGIGRHVSCVRGIGLRLVPVLRSFHVAGFLRLFGLNKAVLGPVGERGLPLAELDAGVAKVGHEVRHCSDGDPRRYRLRKREAGIFKGRQGKLNAQFVEFLERLDR